MPGVVSSSSTGDKVLAGHHPVGSWCEGTLPQTSLHKAACPVGSVWHGDVRPEQPLSWNKCQSDGYYGRYDIQEPQHSKWSIVHMYMYNLVLCISDFDEFTRDLGGGREGEILSTPCIVAIWIHACLHTIIIAAWCNHSSSLASLPLISLRYGTSWLQLTCVFILLLIRSGRQRVQLHPLVSSHWSSK